MNYSQLVGCGFGVVLTVMLSFFATFTEPNLCSMSYSRPVYHPIEFQSSHSAAGHRYKTFLYREGGVSYQYTGPESLGGTPVIFIPGNAGSYSQGRSMASLGATLAKEIGSETSFDFFLIHFDEDLSAFLGKTLTNQGHYVNDAVSHILNMYAGRQNPPQSVVLIGHSMGGLVARIMVTLDNYVPHSVNTIYTLSTPHLVPPLTMDRGVTEVYDKVNLFWRQSFNRSDESRLDEMTLVSISGGHTDTLVPPEYTPVFSIVPPSHGFSAYSYSIPNVWRGQDHLCIVWCYELRQVLIESLFAVVDPKRRQRTRPQEERIAIFSHYMKSPLDDWKLINSNNALVYNKKIIDEGLTVDDSFTSPIGPLSIVAYNDPRPGKIPFNITEDAYVSIWNLLWGTSLDVTTKFLDIPLPSIKTSLFAMKVSMETDETNVALRHWVPSTSESRWYDTKETRIFWYSSSIFVPYPVQSHDCLHLQIIAPEHSPSDKPIKLHISIDVWASLANSLIRYRTVLLCFPAGIVLLIFLVQLHNSSIGKNVSFRASMDIFIKHYLTPLLIFATVVQYLLCFTTFRNVIRALQIPSERDNIASLNSSRYDIVDLFAGVDEPSLIFIAPLLITVSTTAVVLIERVLSILVVYVFAPVGRLLNSASQKMGNNIAAKALGNIKESFKILVITLLVLTAPHQCVFVGAALVQLIQTKSTAGFTYSATNIFFWTGIVDVPILAVWFRDFRFNLTFDIIDIVNIASAAPSVLFVYLMGKRYNESDEVILGSYRWMQVATYSFVAYFAYYSLMHGFMHTFMMHYFANLLAGWFIFMAANKPNQVDKKKL